MLAQAVVASYMTKESDGYHLGQLTGTGISPCPYATYLKFHHIDEEEFDPASRMRMKNGKWQELEALEELRKAGYTVRNTGTNQLTVHIGRAKIAGRPDGIINVNGDEFLLEIKAMSLNMFTDLRQKGIDAFPNYKCQVQVYMASNELKDKIPGCYFYARHKDSCRPYDIYIEKDFTYSKPIVEAADAIVLEGYEPKKPSSPMPLCQKCRHSNFCWKSVILDTSSTKVLTKPEVVQMWLEAQVHLEIGKQLNEEARALLKEYLGDNDTLYCDDQTTLLEIKKIIQHRSEFDSVEFVKKYGAAALGSVMKEKIVEQMRVTRKN